MLRAEPISRGVEPIVDPLSIVFLTRVISSCSGMEVVRSTNRRFLKIICAFKKVSSDSD